MTKTIDVTDKVDFGWNDDEALPIKKCVCGKEFSLWEYVIGIYEDNPHECPECGAKLYFRIKTTIYQVLDE